VVELRQYTLHPGQRESLISLFERELVEPQEAAGMRLIGQFRDLDRTDRFVWLRGFSDMVSRRAALEAFYGGPVWRAHSAAANATMIDSDDVLLLRPVNEASAFPKSPETLGPRDRRPAGAYVVTICSLGAAADPGVLERTLLPALAATSSPALGVFVEEASENTYPALPVRTGEHVVVWVQQTAHDDESLRAAIADSHELARTRLPQLAGPPIHLRLDPTPRSRLR
jgi:NIPSNAP